jgi:hypothetical protein
MDNIENSKDSLQNIPKPKINKDDFIMGLSKNTIIVLLMGLVVLALLGFNIFLGIGLVLDKLFDGVKNIFVKLLSMIGFYTGAAINTTADVVGDTAKETIDIAEGSIQSLGHLLQNRDNMGDQTIDQKQWDLNVFNLNPTTNVSPDDNSDKMLEINQLKQELLAAQNDTNIRQKEKQI